MNRQQKRAAKSKKPETRPMKLAICIPSGDQVYVQFALSLVNLVTDCTLCGIETACIVQQSSVVEWGRELLVKKAQEINADYMLFLDTDMTFPHDTARRLIDRNVDVICTNAARRRSPYTSVVKYFPGHGDAPAADPTNEEVSKLIGLSTGVLLVKMSVFDKISKPYFQVSFKEGVEDFLGEDYYFGKKLSLEGGIDSHCDNVLSKEIGHIGVKPFYVTDQ